VKPKIVVVGLVTFVVGFLLGQARSLVPSPGPASRPPPAAEPAALPSSCSELAEVREGMAADRKVLQQVDLDAIRASRGEVVASWPDAEMGEMYPGDMVLRLKKAGAEVLHSSCLEYPCVVGLRGISSETVTAALTEEGERPTVTERDGHVVVVAPLHPGDERTTKRVRALATVLAGQGRE